MAKRRKFIDQFLAKVALEALRGDMGGKQQISAYEPVQNLVASYKVFFRNSDGLSVTSVTSVTI